MIMLLVYLAGNSIVLSAGFMALAIFFTVLFTILLISIERIFWCYLISGVVCFFVSIAILSQETCITMLTIPELFKIDKESVISEFGEENMKLVTRSWLEDVIKANKRWVNND